MLGFRFFWGGEAVWSLIISAVVIGVIASIVWMATHRLRAVIGSTILLFLLAAGGVVALSYCMATQHRKTVGTVKAREWQIDIANVGGVATVVNDYAIWVKTERGGLRQKKIPMAITQIERRLRAEPCVEVWEEVTVDDPEAPKSAWYLPMTLGRRQSLSHYVLVVPEEAVVH